MKKLGKISIALLAITAAATAFAASPKKQAKPQPVETRLARPTSDAVKKSLIYQILLPVFTQEGTLKKAQEMLPHIKSLGTDIVYLCPVAEADDDENQAFWSKRQKASKTGNPKNPYRIKDYYKIDPMHGTDADLKNFVDAAHELGLKVILDLVYYHCGPTAVFIKTNPDFVVRDEKGNVKNGRWNFPELNFKNPELCEYLYKNMEYFIKKFDVDGYRTDVEPSVPSFFWTEAYKRISKIKPDLFMLAEGERADAQLDAYDANYSFKWEYGVIDTFYARKPASNLREIWERQDKKFVKGARLVRALDNHDTSSDSCDPTKGGMRFEKAFGHRGVDAIQVLNFTIDGIPFIYNGNEFADDNAISMFSTNKHGRYFVGWENLPTKEGQARMELIRKLAKIHSDNTAIWNGSTTWLDNTKPESIVSFTRNSSGENILVVVNTRNAAVDVEVSLEISVATTMLDYGSKYSKDGGVILFKLQPYGYSVIRYK